MVDAHSLAGRVVLVTNGVYQIGGAAVSGMSNRVAVTYLALPEYGMSNSSSFQIELFFDGIIRMTWLQIDAVNAAVGLARGIGQPVGQFNPQKRTACPSSN